MRIVEVFLFYPTKHNFLMASSVLHLLYVGSTICLILVPFYLSYYMYLFPIIVVGSDRRLDEDEVDNLPSRRLSSTASAVSELNQGFVRCSMSSSVSSDTPSPNNISVR